MTTIIETRYRDLPWEEILKAHPQPPFINFDSKSKWESERRGKSIQVMTPPFQMNGECGSPMVNIVGHDDWYACTHIAEIGD